MLLKQESGHGESEGVLVITNAIVLESGLTRKRLCMDDKPVCALVIDIMHLYVKCRHNADLAISSMAHVFRHLILCT